MQLTPHGTPPPTTDPCLGLLHLSLRVAFSEHTCTVSGYDETPSSLTQNDTFYFLCFLIQIPHTSGCFRGTADAHMHADARNTPHTSRCSLSHLFGFLFSLPIAENAFLHKEATQKGLISIVRVSPALVIGTNPEPQTVCTSVFLSLLCISSSVFRQ